MPNKGYIGFADEHGMPGAHASLGRVAVHIRRTEALQIIRAAPLQKGRQGEESAGTNGLGYLHLHGFGVKVDKASAVALPEGCQGWKP